MIAIDTNVLVRFFAKDDRDAYSIAETLIAEGPVTISTTVFLEANWVLQSTYDFPKGEVLNAFASLLELPSVEALDGEVVDRAIGWSRAGLDFADALHLAQAARSDVFATFDVPLAKKARRLSNAPTVSHPRKPDR